MKGGSKKQQGLASSAENMPLQKQQKDLFYWIRYIMCCQWCADEPIDTKEQPETSIIEYLRQTFSVAQLTKQLTSQSYQDRERIISHIQRISKEDLKDPKPTVLNLYAQISKFYMYYSQYSEALRYLSLIYTEKKRLEDYGISVNQLKISIFICKTCRSIQNQHFEVEQFNYLKQEYLQLLSLIGQQDQNHTIKCQKVLFITQLIYCFYFLAKEKIQPKPLKTDMAIIYFIENIQGIVNSYGLRLTIKKQQSKIIASPKLYHLKEPIQRLNQSIQKMNYKVFDLGPSESDITDQDYSHENQPKYLDQPSVPVESSQLVELFGRYYSDIFQQESYKQYQHGLKVYKRLQKQQASNVGATIQIMTLWNLNAVFVTLYKTQENWLNIFQGKQYCLFSKEYVFNQGIGIKLKIQQHSIIQTDNVAEFAIQNLFASLGIQSTRKNKTPHLQIENLGNIQFQMPMQNIQRSNNAQQFQVVQRKKLDREKFKRKNKGIQMAVFDKGLINIGNTCYMNSALQCLHKSRHFTKKFLQQAESMQLIFANTRTFQLTKLFQQFVPIMWKSKQPLNPREIKIVMGQKNFLFRHNNQSDATQFLITFLQIIRDELNDPNQAEPKQIDHYHQRFQTIYQKLKQNDAIQYRSVVESTFTGRYRVVYSSTVPQCRHKYTLFQQFNVHYISIPPNTHSLTLHQCLQHFTETEVLKGENVMTCELCHAATLGEKKMEIYEANKVLVLGFKRFLNGHKNDARIQVPEFLQVQDVICGPLQGYKGMRYKMYGAIIHFGDLNGGHYIAVCYNHKAEKWMKYNDSEVTQTSQNFSEIDFGNAMTLFYELIDSQQAFLANNIKNDVKEILNNHCLNKIDEATYIIQCFSRLTTFPLLLGAKIKNLNIRQTSLAKRYLSLASNLQDQSFHSQILVLSKLLRQRQDSHGQRGIVRLKNLLILYLQTVNQQIIESQINEQDQTQFLSNVFGITYHCSSLCTNNFKHEYKQQQIIHTVKVSATQSSFIKTLQSYKEPKIFEEKKRQKCSKCSKCRPNQCYVRQERRIFLIKIGPIFMMELNRGERSKRKGQLVKIPLQMKPAEINQLFQNAENANKIYHLSVVFAQHHDAADGSFSVHYFNYQTLIWTSYENGIKRQTQSQRIQFHNPYMLIYQLCPIQK